MTDSLLLNAISWAREAGAVHLRYFRGNQLEIKPTRLPRNSSSTI